MNERSLGEGADLASPSVHFKMSEKWWTPTEAGSYSLTAKATDNHGAVGTTALVVITVTEQPEPRSFRVSFAHTGDASTQIITQDYTLDGGPVGGGRLIPAMRVVPDTERAFYFGAQRQEVYRISAHDGAVTRIEPSGPGIPELSWPMGVAYNLEADRAVLVSLGGEGFLYSYDPDPGSWALISSMNNLDLESIEYDPESDNYFGTSAFLHRGTPLHVYQISATGERVETITIFDAVPSTGPEYYTSETIDLPNGKIAVLLEPESHFAGNITGGESKIYLVDPAAKTATLTYRKAWSEIPDVSVAILQPQNGAVFEAGAAIEIAARSTQGTRPVEGVQFFANDRFLGDGVRDPQDPTIFKFRWVEVPSGAVSLTARAIGVGASAVSRPISITVGTLSTLIGAVRDLPAAYTAGITFQVKIAVTVKDSVHAYAVEDVPPVGWEVSQISHDGVFDPITRKIKFGFFTDQQSRVLTYFISPPLSASGEATFSGHASANGSIQRIQGNNRIGSAPLHHPADASPEDNKVSISELTAYASAWKEGGEWADPVQQIPVSYVTRAGTIWKQGEAYSFDPSAGPAPLCWVPLDSFAEAAGETVASPSGGGVAGVTRSIVGNGGNFDVQITAEPGTGTTVYAVEEQIPAGWAVLQPDAGGTVNGNIIRWGPFYDSVPRTFKYTAVVTGDREGIFHGSLSFDGLVEMIRGETKSRSGRPTLIIGRTASTVNIELSSPAVTDGVIEGADSLDSQDWIEVGRIAEGSSHAAIPETGWTKRFFRIRWLE